MSGQAFTNADYGKQVRIEQYGREVHLIFVASSDDKANSLVENILSQLKAGAINITLMGKPTAVIEES
jgi:hypothetical protein